MKYKAPHTPFNALLDAVPAFTAALCVDPNCAALLAEAAQSRGIAIPRQLSIACFHSKCQAPADWAGPRADFELMGTRAVEALVRGRFFCDRVPAPWHQGKTVAPPPAV